MTEVWFLSISFLIAAAFFGYLATLRLGADWTHILGWILLAATMSAQIFERKFAIVMRPELAEFFTQHNNYAAAVMITAFMAWCLGGILCLKERRIRRHWRRFLRRMQTKTAL
jgi:hypothetical protein